MRRISLLVMVALLVGTWSMAGVLAQDVSVPTPSAGATATPTEVTGEPTAPVPNDAIPEAFYKKAQQWLGSGEPDSGRLLMRDLSREYPGTAYGRRAHDWLAANGTLDHSGRVEFIISSTLLGAYLGFTTVLGLANLNDSLADDESKAMIWASVAGAGLGLTGSVLGSTQISVSDAQARLYGFLGLWGWFNGFFIYDLLEPLWDKPSNALLSGGAGMLVGVGASMALWNRLDVNAGTAELATGMAVYTTYFATLANFFFAGTDAYSDYETLATLVMLLPANAAFVGGFFLGDELQWPAGDLRLIELGGFLGGLVGVATLATIQPEGSSDSVTRTVTGTMALTTAAGLVGAALVLQPWDHRASVRSDRRPSGLNGLVTYDGEMWNVGAPLPNILPRDVDGRTGIAMELPLLSVRL